MGTEENKAVIRRLVEEFLNKRNVAVVDEIFAVDFVDRQGALTPTGDRESVKQFVAAIMAGFPDMRFDIEQLIAEGDEVFVLVTGRGTHTGEFRGVAATGRPVVTAGMMCVWPRARLPSAGTSRTPRASCSSSPRREAQSVGTELQLCPGPS